MKEKSPEPLAAFNQSRILILRHLDRAEIVPIGREHILGLQFLGRIGRPDHEAYWIFRHGIGGLDDIVLSRSLLAGHTVYAVGVTFKTVVYVSRTTSPTSVPRRRASFARHLHNIYKCALPRFPHGVPF